VNNEIKNAMINGNFSIKDHQWLLFFQRPFLFLFLHSLNRRTILEFISFVGMLCGINASSLSITFTLATTHHRLLSCIFYPSASPSLRLKPPGDANWTTQIFDGQHHKCMTHSAHGMVTTCHWRFQRRRNALWGHVEGFGR